MYSLFLTFIKKTAMSNLQIGFLSLQKAEEGHPLSDSARTITRHCHQGCTKAEAEAEKAPAFDTALRGTCSWTCIT